MKLGIGLPLVNNPLLCVPLSERPTLDLNFALGNYTTNGFASQPSVGSTSITLPSVNGPSATLTRGSTATYRYSDGYLRYAPENLLTYSEQFNNASVWITAGRLTVSANTTETTDPKGGSTADKVTETVDNGTHRVLQSNSFTANTTQTASVFWKKGTRRWVHITIQTNSVPATQLLQWFDLDSVALGQFSTGSGGTEATKVSADIQDVGDGWRRCSLTVAFGATVTAGVGVTGFLTGLASADGTNSYAGATNQYGYIWGAQLERHSGARPYISTVANQVFGPRFEYTAPPSIEPLGLLIEEESENLLTYTEDFNNAAWLKVAATYVGTTTAPNNTNTASTLNATSTSNVVRQAATVLASTKYVFSFYVKRGTATNLKYAIYNISALSFIIGPTSYYSSTSNEWSRITVAFTTPVGCTSVGVYVMSDTGSTGTASFWGAQLEKKEFVTSYIPNPTTGSAVRSADYCTATLPSGLISTTQGTVVVTADRTRDPALASGGSGDPTVEFRDSGNVSMLQYYNVADATEYVYFGLGSIPLNLGDVTTENTLFTVGWTYNDDLPALNASIDGGSLVTDTTSGLIYEPTTLLIGSSIDLGQTMNGHIKSIEYRPKDLTNRLQAYTD